MIGKTRWIRNKNDGHQSHFECHSQFRSIKHTGIALNIFYCCMNVSMYGPCSHTHAIYRKNSKNRLNRFDGCKQTVAWTPTDSIATRWQTELRNTHIHHLRFLLHWLYTLLLEVHLCLSSLPSPSSPSSWSCFAFVFCRFICMQRTTYVHRTPSVKLLLLFLLQASTSAPRPSEFGRVCVYCVCVCMCLLFCQRMPGYFSITTLSTCAQARNGRARNCVCVCACVGERRRMKFPLCSVWSHRADGGVYIEYRCAYEYEHEHSAASPNNLVSLLLD